MSGEQKEYRYREGVHGEHCIDYGALEWKRIGTVGRAATKQDADQMIALLNTKPRPCPHDEIRYFHSGREQRQCLKCGKLLPY